MTEQKNESRKPGWFSRRHSTREAHEQAVATHATKADRQLDAGARRVDTEGLTPQERLARLDKRLGKGVGAVKERTRLQIQIELSSGETLVREIFEKP